jgi:hypothetical protein
MVGSNYKGSASVIDGKQHLKKVCKTVSATRQYANIKHALFSCLFMSFLILFFT